MKRPRRERTAREAAPRPQLDPAAADRALDAAAWAVIAAFAAVLAWFVAGPHRVGDVFTETDFYGAYAEGARLIQQGRLEPARYAVVGPLFEMLLALAGFVVRDLFLAAELLSAAAMIGALVLWRRTLRHLAGPGAALVAVALLAANAQVLRYGYAVTTDALALALQAAALCALLTGTGRRSAFAAGALAALAFLTRYTHGVLLVAGPLAVFAGWTGAARADRRRHALAFAAGFLVPVAPWLAYSLTHGGGGPVQLHHNIAYDVFARARGIPWDTYQRDMQSQFPTPWSVFARDPAAVSARLLFNIGDHLRLDALRTAGPALAVSAAAGLLLAWRERTLVRVAPVLLACGLTFLALVPAFHSERYAMAVLPAWVALAALAFAPPARAAQRWRWPRLALAMVPVVLGGLASASMQSRALSQLPLEVLEAARQARPYLHRGERVLARKPHFAFHAGLTPLAFPFVSTLPELADYARRHDVRWLYFSWPEAEMRPDFMYLLDTTSAVPGLTVRAATHDHPAVLYEIGPGFGTAPAWADNDTLAAVHRALAAAAINDHDVPSRMLLALHARHEARWSEAAPWLEASARLAPNDPFVLGQLADNYTRTGDYAASEATWQRVEALTPGSPEVRIGRGSNALLDGRPGAAATLWRPVVSACGDPVTLRRMLELFSQAGDDGAVAEVRARMRALGVTP